MRSSQRNPSSLRQWQRNPSPLADLLMSAGIGDDRRVDRLACLWSKKHDVTLETLLLCCPADRFKLIHSLRDGSPNDLTSEEQHRVVCHCTAITGGADAAADLAVAYTAACEEAKRSKKLNNTYKSQVSVLESTVQGLRQVVCDTNASATALRKECHTLKKQLLQFETQLRDILIQQNIVSDGAIPPHLEAAPGIDESFHASGPSGADLADCNQLLSSLKHYFSRKKHLIDTHPRCLCPMPALLTSGKTLTCSHCLQQATDTYCLGCHTSAAANADSSSKAPAQMPLCSSCFLVLPAHSSYVEVIDNVLIHSNN